MSLERKIVSAIHTNLQILVRLAGKHVFSFDGDVFCQHFVGGDVYLGPGTLVLLKFKWYILSKIYFCQEYPDYSPA